MNIKHLSCLSLVIHSQCVTLAQGNSQTLFHYINTNFTGFNKLYNFKFRSLNICNIKVNMSYLILFI